MYYSKAGNAWRSARRGAGGVVSITRGSCFVLWVRARLVSPVDYFNLAATSQTTNNFWFIGILQPAGRMHAAASPLSDGGRLKC